MAPKSKKKKKEMDSEDIQDLGEDDLVEFDVSDSGSKHVAKQKPELAPEQKRAMRIRSENRNGRAKFRRQEWFRYKRLEEKWRRPRGLHSKMRRRLKYRPKMVSIGFGAPAESKYLHPSGFAEVLVYNLNDLEGIDPKTEAVRIGRTVGMKKRIQIESKANKLGIRVLNSLVN